MEFTVRISWMSDNLTTYRIGDNVRVDLWGGYDPMEGVIADLDNTTMWFAIDGEKPLIIIDMEEIRSMYKLD